ncbi:MAG: hypothetical protein H0T73_12305 [Ardenticatenales bacterium]|nr:hypothetical protein [Ardenticatenales bacterium]
MNIVQNIWTRGPLARAFLMALLLVSVIPIISLSLLFVRQSTDALTYQMQANLQSLVQAKASEINGRLTEVLHTTEIAADQVEMVLQHEIDPTEVEARLSRYQPDERNILGLDIYYNQQGGASEMGEGLSNVYWDNRLPPSSAVGRQIVQTEVLDPIFASIKGVNPDTKWIYFTSPEGMMRLYPWASNDHYPTGWNPREIIFYSVAEPANNPKLAPRWTPPYVDYAGAGWMTTLSIPVIDRVSGEFQGVMSHDITIDSLKDIALDIHVLDGSGYGFLIDPQGRVVAHPEFASAVDAQGSQAEVNLLEKGSPDFQALVQRMVDGESGLGYFEDESLSEQMLVYAPITTTGWSLGIVVPRTEVVAPAKAMQTRAFFIAAGVALLTTLLAVLLTHILHQPLVRLLAGVRLVTEGHEVKPLELDSFNEVNRLADAFNKMAAKVGERERNLKAKVAELKIEIDIQRRQLEVDSIIETDYFKELEMKAEGLRNRLRLIE